MIVDCEQRSAEWIALRVGKVTASRVCDVLSELKKGGETAARRNYRTQVICERLTGLATDHYVTPEMQWGTETEPFARAAYEMERDREVDTVGFALHPSIEQFGASPDGLVGSDGLVEFKCPTTTTHIGYLLAKTVPEDYQPQMLAEMACTGRSWCDFVSFDPRLPKHLQLFVRRFERDDARILEMEQKVRFFLDEVENVLAELIVGDF